MAEVRPNASRPRVEYTGADTPAGRYIRRFWQPIYVSADLARGTAKHVTVVNHDHTLYRAADGAVHLLDARCPHRGARLALGWVEGSSLRCRYHGWRYEASGQCVEQPAEEACFAHKVRIASYPTIERYGVVWAFLGTGTPPPFPEFFGGVDGLEFFHFVMVRRCNYFQDLENLIDDVHLSFLHTTSNFRDPAWGRSPPAPSSVPKIEASEAAFGLIQRSSSADGRGRSVAFVMPNAVFFKTAAHRDLQGFDAMNWSIPIDDHRHTFFQIVAVPSAQPDALERFRALFEKPVEHGREALLAQLDADVDAVLAGEKTLADLIDRGLETVHVEDGVMQEAQGTIVDRDREQLGVSDKGIVLLRKVWIRELSALVAGNALTPFHVPDRIHSLRAALVTPPGPTTAAPR